MSAGLSSRHQIFPKDVIDVIAGPPQLAEKFWAAKGAGLVAGREDDREGSAGEPAQQQRCLIRWGPVGIDAD